MQKYIVRGARPLHGEVRVSGAKNAAVAIIPAALMVLVLIIKPEGLCDSAWGSMREFVEELARGGGNFFDGWMKDPRSAMISCNDGFRPVSFYLEAIEP